MRYPYLDWAEEIKSRIEAELTAASSRNAILYDPMCGSGWLPMLVKAWLPATEVICSDVMQA